MRKRQYNLLDELIVDNFAGGGGASTGIELALGRPVDIAINHDPAAIAMHKANHPLTQHFCESVWAIDPVKVTQGRPVALCWFSPDCKHFSKAKGGTPVSKNIRGLAWVVLRWAAKAKPRVIILENVEEFQTWGPVRKGRPVKARQGETFRRWKDQLHALGYEIEHRELVAADYGAPTIRKRFFLIARRDGRPIVWPAPTHAKDGANGLKPWRTAAEIIDWSLPCPSIFSTKEEVKAEYGQTAVRPLADNTMRRVARGVDKFVIKAARPFIVPVGYGEREGQLPRLHSIDAPVSTVVSTGKQYLASPFVAKFQQNSIGTSPDEPTDTVMAGATRFGLVAPSLMSYKFDNAPESVQNPMSTATSVNSHLLLTPVMTAIGQTGGGDRARGVDQPVITSVSKAEACLMAPSLIQYHQEHPAEYVRGQAVDAPIMTTDAANRYAINMASLIKYYGQGVGQDLSEPAHTTTARDREALTVAHMSKFFSGGYDGAGNRPDDPLSTITAVDHNALVTGHLITLRNHMDGQDAREPIATICASSEHHGIVKTYLAKAGGLDLHRWPQIRALLNKYCGYSMAEDEVLLLEIGGVLWYIADIGLRMLTPRELYAANGAPADYIIDVDADGKPYPKCEQVARCGNMVPPPFAEAIVRANLPDLAARRKLETMDALKDYMAI